ncbi:MAG TPA: hypothetical protein VK745_27090, partial [Polyangiaceae bacterium]|nr:hypothetical protein [Polyangiaceae bacterium]
VQDIGCMLGECKSIVDTTLAAVRLFSLDDIRAAAAVLQSIDLARLDALARVQAKDFQVPRGDVSGKEAARDVPSWAKGNRPKVGEAGKDFAKRLLDEKYGPNNYPKGPGSEFNQVKKWGDRGFRNP